MSTYIQWAFTGEIRIFGGYYCPEGWAFCDGQMLTVAGNEELFALIGTAYGGDGRVNFGLPDFRGRFVLGAGVAPQSGTTYAMGQKAGTETVTLLPENLPAHTHTVNVASQDQNIPTGLGPQNNFFGPTEGPQVRNLYGTADTGGTPVTMAAQTIMAAGTSKPIGNQQPYLPINYILCLHGNFPPRS